MTAVSDVQKRLANFINCSAKKMLLACRTTLTVVVL